MIFKVWCGFISLFRLDEFGYVLDLDITYVVRNEIGANETFSGKETEYLFLYLNPPYLLEKDYDGKVS